MIVAYAPDLADRSRIDAALTGVTFVKSVAELASVDAAVVIIDLSRAADIPSIKARRVIGFGSHLDEDLFARASAAGVEAVPRSRFFRDIAAAIS